MIKLRIIAAIWAMIFSAGCVSLAEPAAQNAEPVRYAAATATDITVEQILNEYNSSRKAVEIQAEENDPHAPLAVAGCACQMGDSYILFPKVDCAAAEIINSTICAAVTERAEQLGMVVFADYRVEYNRNGIFSIRMFLYDMYGDNEACIDCIPLTFNSETGERYRISDFFDSENQNWRGRIPDIITAQAADSQMVLLSDIMPISDDRPFYITDEAVVIMYDLYEIATYSAGEPEFEIAVDDIAECLDDFSALNVMLPAVDVANEGTIGTEGEVNAEELPDEPEEQAPEQVEMTQEQQGDAENTGDTEDLPEQPEYMENTDDGENMSEQLQEDTEEKETEPAEITEEEELTVTEEAQ